MSGSMAFDMPTHPTPSMGVTVRLHSSADIGVEVRPDVGVTWRMPACAPGSDPPMAFHGVASDGRRCQAITAAGVRCPKDGAVAYLVLDMRPVHACGTHHGVHRRGGVLELVVEP